MSDTKESKPISALFSGFAMMLGVLLWTKSLGYAVGCGLFSMLLFYGQNQPKPAK